MKKHHMSIPNKPIKFTFFALKGYLWWFLLATFFVIFVEVLGGAGSYSLQKVIDAANGYISKENSLRIVLFWTLALPVFHLGYAASYRVSAFIMHYLTIYARTGVARLIFEYLSEHSLSYFSDRFAGSLGSRVTTISQNVVRLLSLFLWQVVSNFSAIIINLALTFSVYLPLGAAMTIAFIALVPLNLFLTRKQVALSERMSATAAKLRAQIIDTVTNIIAVQQFARKKFELAEMDKTINEHRDADLKSDNYREFVLLINNILGAIIIAGGIFWSFMLWSQEVITLGQFVLVMTISGSIMWSLTFVGQWLNNIMEAYGELSDGLKEIIVPHEIVEVPNAKKLKVDKGSVYLNEVSFQYTDADKKLFSKLSLEIQPGEKIGVVGKSGAGKTTLMKLLLRQHDLTGGSICIDDQDISWVTLDSLREAVAIVPQEPFLFHRTIEENILYGNPKATNKEMVEVAKKAQAHEFIDELPEKYKTVVGERGVKLSVGQRQRIAIARAFLKNAPILILDEATSALDSESEVAVQKALQNLMEGKTVFAVAHRLSTLREMDRILVFKDGKIVEDGKHEELVEKEGVYASLWEHQAGGFLKEN